MNTRLKTAVICAAIVLLLPASWAGAQTTMELYSAEQWYYVTPSFGAEYGQVFCATISSPNKVPGDSSLTEAWMKILVPEGMTVTSHYRLQIWPNPPNSYYTARQQPNIVARYFVTLGAGAHWVGPGTIPGSNALCNGPVLISMDIDSWTGTGDIGIWGSSSNDGGAFNDATLGWKDPMSGESLGNTLSDREYQVKVAYEPIPEPSSMLALAGGLGVLGGLIRRRRR